MEEKKRKDKDDFIIRLSERNLRVETRGEVTPQFELKFSPNGKSTLNSRRRRRRRGVL